MGIPTKIFNFLEIQNLPFELYSFVAQVRYAHLVLRTTLVFDEPPRSNLRRLADKQACRLGFAWLSAPSLALRAAT